MATVLDKPFAASDSATVQNKLGLYQVSIEVAPEGIVGGASLTLNLLVNAPDGEVYGSGEITQALAPPYGNRPISDISGQIRHTGFGKDEMLVQLTGRYFMPGPPTQPFEVECTLFAGFVVDPHWNGSGSFRYGPGGRQATKQAKVTRTGSATE